MKISWPSQKTPTLKFIFCNKDSSTTLFFVCPIIFCRHCNAGTLSWLVSLSGLVWFHNFLRKVWPLWKTHLQVCNKVYTLEHILSKCALKYKTRYVLKYQLHYLQVFSCDEKCGLVHGSVYSKFDCICPSISLLHEVRHYRFMFEFTYVSMILARVYRLAQ